MEQRIEISVRMAAIWMYSCHKRYAWCNYQRDTLEIEAQTRLLCVLNTPPELYLELLYVKQEK